MTGAVRINSGASVAGAVGRSALVLGVLVAAAAFANAGQGSSVATAVALAIAVPFGILALVRPALAALALLLVVGLVPRAQLEAVTLPVGGSLGLQTTDVLLGIAMAGWLLRAVVVGDDVVPPPSVLLPLVLMGSIVGFAFLTAQTFGTSPNLSLIELRGLAPYALIIPLAAERDPRTYSRALLLLLAGAAVSSLLALNDFIAHGALSVTEQEMPANRVLGDAFLLPVLGITFVFSRWAAGLRPVAGQPGVAPALVVIMGAALFVTFQRGAWLALLGALAVVTLLSPRGRRRRALAWSALVVALVVGAAAPLISPVTRSSQLLAVTSARIASIGDSENVSNKHRLLEWQAAVRNIKTHPLRGIGLGSSITFYSPMYSPVTHRMGGSYTEFYIHNSYIWTALKLGIPGLLILIWIVGYPLAVTVLDAKSTDPRRRSLVVGGAACVVAFLVLSLTGPHLTYARSATYAAGIVGMLVALREGHS